MQTIVRKSIDQFPGLTLIEHLTPLCSKEATNWKGITVDIVHVMCSERQ